MNGNLDEKHTEENCFTQKISFVSSDVTCHLWKSSLFPPGLCLVEEKGSATRPLLWLTDLLPVLTFLVREQRNDSKTEALAGRLQIIRVPPYTCSRPLWRSLRANGGRLSSLTFTSGGFFFSPPFSRSQWGPSRRCFAWFPSSASVCDQIPDKTNEIPLSLRCSLWRRLV